MKTVHLRVARLKAMTRIAASLAALAILAGSVGCRVQPPAETSSTIGQLPTILPALSSDIQDAGLAPRSIFIPQDSKFGAWGVQALATGWVAAGQYYDAKGQGARIEYYDQDGLPRWTYQRPLSEYDSCYICAAVRPDGSLIAGGRDSDGLKPSVGLLTAFDPNCKIIWETHIDYPKDENIGLMVVRCMVAKDGRILAVVDSSDYYVSIYEGRQPTVLYSFDPDGNLLWQKELDFSGMAYSQAAVLDDNGGFYLAVYGFRTDEENQSEGFSWLLHIDRDGQELWRQDLTDERYQYQVVRLARDQDGNLFAACSARYAGEIPDPPAQTAVFHDRYRSYAYHPAALLKLDPGGTLMWQKFLNGEFGAASQDVVCEDGHVYWKVNLVDDIVKPYIFMSVDHRAVGHEVMMAADLSGGDPVYHQFSREESGQQLIQRIEDGQPVLIGWEPVKENPAWTETLPAETSGQQTSATTAYVEPTKE